MPTCASVEHPRSCCVLVDIPCVYPDVLPPFNCTRCCSNSVFRQCRKEGLWCAQDNNCSDGLKGRCKLCQSEAKSSRRKRTKRDGPAGDKTAEKTERDGEAAALSLVEQAVEAEAEAAQALCQPTGQPAAAMYVPRGYAGVPLAQHVVEAISAVVMHSTTVQQH